MNRNNGDTSESRAQRPAAAVTVQPRPPSADPEDGQLVARSAGGDAAAFEKLFVKHRQRVFGAAWRVLHNEDAALDVVQDAFVRAYEQLGSLRGETNFFPWLRRIAVNLAIDRLRHEKRGVEVAFDEAQFGAGEEADQDRLPADPRERAEQEAPERRAELKEFTADLQLALQKLSPAHRAVFMLHAAEGMTYQEIADALKCNIGTVMSRLFYARKQLQKLLAAHLEARV
jgi:RNA polymerase sigma-70 factor (ECF subfamily)